MIKVVAVEFFPAPSNQDGLHQFMAVMGVITNTFNNEFPELNLRLPHVREVEDE